MKNILLYISMLMIISLGFSQENVKPIIPSNKLVYGLSYINIKGDINSKRNEIFSRYLGYEYSTFAVSTGWRSIKNAIVGFHYSYPTNHILNNSLEVKYKSWDIHFMLGDDLTESVKFDFYFMYGLGFKHSSLSYEVDKSKKSDDDLLINLSNILRYNINYKGSGPTLSFMIRYGVNIDILSSELLFHKNNISPMLTPYVQLSIGYTMFKLQ